MILRSSFFLALVGLLLVSAACARKLTPLSVFPARTVWLTPGDDVLEPPLAADDARVFSAGRGGSVRALDRFTGAERWSLAGRPGVLSAGHGLLVLRQEDGNVQALDPATGETRWQARTGIAGRLPAVISEGRILVAGAGVASLDAASGSSLWLGPEAPAVTAPPAISGPWAFLGMEDGTLRCLDAATGVLLWTYESGSPLNAAPAMDDRSRVLLGTSDRRVVALRADKRGQERWRWRVGADVRSAPVVFGSNALVASYDAVLYALNRANGHMSWRAPLPSRPVSGPLLFGSAVLVACLEKDIVGFDARTGARLGALATPAPLQTPPLIRDEWLYVGLRDRSVVALRLGQEAEAPPSPGASPAPPRPRRRGASPSPTPSPTPEPTPDP